MSRFYHKGQVVYIDNYGDEHVFYLDDGSLRFVNTTIPKASFVADTTYQDYPYRASVALEGVLSSMIPQVALSVADAVSGNFAPAAQSYNGGVYIYAASPPDGDITIPTMIFWRGNA